MGRFLETNFEEKSRSAFVAFMNAMHDWEVISYKKGVEAFADEASAAHIEDQVRENLAKIFEKYVVKGGRNYDRIENLVCGMHPDDDLDRDDIEVEKENDGEVSILIKKTTGLCSLFRLTLTLQDGECKVSRRDLKSDEGWEVTYV